MLKQLLQETAAQTEQLTKTLDAAADYIEQLEARVALLESQIKFYEDTCGAYEDVQAQAVAPEPHYLTFEDVLADQELTEAMQEELTDEQKMYYYNQQTEQQQ